MADIDPVRIFKNENNGAGFSEKHFVSVPVRCKDPEDLAISFVDTGYYVLLFYVNWGDAQALYLLMGRKK